MGGPQPEQLSATKQSVMKVNPQKHATSRRQRAVLSCTSCRKRKARCDRLTPCTPCVRLDIGNSCTYSSAPRNAAVSVPESTPARSERTRSVENAENTGPTQYPIHRRGVSMSSTLAGDVLDHGADGHTTPESVPSSTQRYLGARHPEQAAPTDSFVQSIAPLSFRGKQQRSRFYGRSHWATTLGMVRNQS